MDALPSPEQYRPDESIAMTVCPGCKLPIDRCAYGGDCLEMRAIYRAEQKEKLQDIFDPAQMNACIGCGVPVDKPYHICYFCENEE